MSIDSDELKTFVAALKADRDAQKQKEQRDSWTKYVSLSLIFIAVLAAIASQKAGGYSSVTLKKLNEATFNQAQASDEWSFFQAKSIKQALNEIEADRASQPNSGASPKMAETLKANAARYASEKNEITVAAKEFERKRDEARDLATSATEHGRAMGLATTLFQIGISVGGICLIVKKRWLWAVSMVLGLLAVFQMLHVIYWMA